MTGHTKEPWVLRQLLDYNSDTGAFTGRQLDCSDLVDDLRRQRWNTRFADKPALTTRRQDGYLVGRILGDLRRAHQVAYAIYYGVWPSGMIDHINGVRADNRIANLRVVSPLDNCRNSALRADNTSGHVGVTWHKRNAMWHARIKVGGRHKSLGYYHDIAAAAAARKAAQSELGFTQRHGKPALTEGQSK